LFNSSPQIGLTPGFKRLFIDFVVRNDLVVEAKAFGESYLPLGRKTDYLPVHRDFLVSGPRLNATRETNTGASKTPRR
jgi:hypothetical protein